MNRGRVTLYVAVSVDGYVADAGGSVDWLDEVVGETSPDEVGSYEAFFAEVDCLVMGSRTYEQVLGFGDWPYGDRPTFVTTERDLPRATDAVELVDGDVAALVEDLHDRYDHVWLVGGAALARSFLRQGLVDELRLTVIPVVLGEGVGLFDGETGHHDATMVEATEYGAGTVELRYELADR